jgi:hypothetical protein
LLKPDHVRYAFGEFDFAGTFRYDDIAPLNGFVATWHLPDKEFRDRALEQARLALHSKATTLQREISLRTCAAHVPGFQTVKMAGYDKQPPSVWEDARIINDAASKFAESYDALVRLGRKRLTIN